MDGSSRTVLHSTGVPCVEGLTIDYDAQILYWIDNLIGNVTYQSRFLRSDTYKKNMAANRIVVSELGTAAYPDPCHNIFQRY